jgi:hypothetical protein
MQRAARGNGSSNFVIHAPDAVLRILETSASSIENHRALCGEPLPRDREPVQVAARYPKLPGGKPRIALTSALDEQILSLFAERILPFDTRRGKNGHGRSPAILRLP